MNGAQRLRLTPPDAYVQLLSAPAPKVLVIGSGALAGLGAPAARDAALAAAALRCQSARVALVFFAGEGAALAEDRFRDLAGLVGLEPEARPHTARQERFDPIDFDLGAETIVNASAGGAIAACLDLDAPSERRLWEALRAERPAP